jgi:hypothetical protein
MKVSREKEPVEKKGSRNSIPPLLQEQATERLISLLHLTWQGGGSACPPQTRSRKLEPVNGPEVDLPGSFLLTLHNG